MSAEEKTRTFTEVVAEALIPAGVWHGSESIPTPSSREIEEAERIAAVVQAVLTNEPGTLVSLGWQRVELFNENDKLRRSQALFAPPPRLWA